MQHLTFKNIVLGFVALNIFSLVANLGLPNGMNTVGTFSSASRGQAPETENKSTPEATSRRTAEQQSARPIAKQLPVVKVLDLPDSETLRLSENTFVDLGWRQTAGTDGEWVGHIGSATEYVPLNAEQIAGILKEAQLKSLPPPPVPHAQTPRAAPKDAPAPPEPINLLDWVPMLMGIFFMMYIRYRITRATVDAAQGAAGMAQRVLSDLLSKPSAAKPAPQATTRVSTLRAHAPAAVIAPVRKSGKSSTVVRPASGLFGLFSGVR